MNNGKLELLHTIYKMIKEYILNNKVKFVSLNDKVTMPIIDNLKILELDETLHHADACYYGVTILHVDEWISKTESVKVANPDKYTIEYIAIKFQEKGKDLPIELVIYTFIHELSHIFTIPEKHKIRNIPIKTKKKLNKLQPLQKSHKKCVPLHHNKSFYLNLIILLRIAEKLNIYHLPKQFNSYMYSNIVRFDSMINPEDGMSKGETPLFIP